jgi:hypothetical protein
MESNKIEDIDTYMRQRKSQKEYASKLEGFEKEKALEAKEEYQSSIKGKFISKATSVGKTLFKPTKSNFSSIKARPTFAMSPAQRMLNQMFVGERTFGTGQNLPVMHGTLTTGQGLINNGDNFEKRTARMFGFGY